MTLKETGQRVRAQLAASAARTKVFYQRNRMLVLGGLTILSIMLIVWARLGFTFDFNRFYAASDSCHWQNPDDRGKPECACNAANRQNLCHVCTGSWKEGNTDYSDGQWKAWDDLNLCDVGCPAKFPYRTERTKKEGGSWTGTQSCVEKPPDCPDGYHAFGATLCEKEGPASTPVQTAPPGATNCETPSPGVHVASVLTVQCGTTQNVLTWTLPAGNDTNALLKNIDGADGVVINANLACHSTLTYTDTAVQAGHTYTYGHKAFADRTSNRVTCPPPTQAPTPTATATLAPTPTATATVAPTPTATATPVPTATRTASPSPTPVPSPLSCAPAAQTVNTGQPAELGAGGGTPPYRWTALGGSPSQGTGKDFDTAYGNPGNYQVGLRDSVSQSAQCSVLVNGAPNPTPTPSPATGSAQLVLSVFGFNVSTGGAESSTVSALGGQQIAINTTVFNSSSTGIISSVTLRAALPDGLTYVPGSTKINNAPSSLDSITAGGLNVGAVGPTQRILVQFRVRVNGASFPAGQSQTTLAVQSQMVGGPDLSGTVNIVVNRPAAATGQPGTVNTGPGDAVLVALLISGIMTLLYVSYTRSPAFRRKEAGRASEDQGPMDFRI